LRRAAARPRRHAKQMRWWVARIERQCKFCACAQVELVVAVVVGEVAVHVTPLRNCATDEARVLPVCCCALFIAAFNASRARASLERTVPGATSSACHLRGGYVVEVVQHQDFTVNGRDARQCLHDVEVIVGASTRWRNSPVPRPRQSHVNLSEPRRCATESGNARAPSGYRRIRRTETCR
jgi:hypothetical protein